MTRMPLFSPQAISVLEAGRILPPDCGAEDLIDRVIATILGAEQRFGTDSRSVRSIRDDFAHAMWQGEVMLGTPTLTNASRGSDRPLGSCVAVPVRWDQPVEVSLPTIEAYYLTNMGSGFNLDGVRDPVTALLTLNAHAEAVATQGNCERYIGNIANLSEQHPRVREFVRAKAGRADLRHFNISVSLSDRFMHELDCGATVSHLDGTSTPSAELWNEIVTSAWLCGDPGLVFLDRFNRDNPTPDLGSYRTTAPCAEIGLTQGESCVFGYLNLRRFYSGNGIDLDRMARITRLLVRILDDAVEVSLDRYPTPTSQAIMVAKRKIGVGVCGLADLLATLGLPYGSEGALQATRDVLTWITYTSKLASRQLAQERGAFPAFAMSRYAATSDFLSTKYGGVGAQTVGPDDWQHLDALIHRDGLLRNATTTALPPSGRTALLLGASNSIEPWFSILRPDGNLQPALSAWLDKEYPDRDRHAKVVAALKAARTCQGADPVPTTGREVFRTATEIAPAAHLRMAAVATACVDEGASKTINLAAESTPHVVGDVFRQAWGLGLKAISVYRDGTVEGQPERL